MDNNIYHMIKNIKKVSGFLGSRGTPIPVSDKEAELSDDASMASATASYEKALESYNESKERLEGKIEAEKAIEDLSPPEQEEEE